LRSIERKLELKESRFKMSQNIRDLIEVKSSWGDLLMINSTLSYIATKFTNRKMNRLNSEKSAKFICLLSRFIGKMLLILKKSRLLSNKKNLASSLTPKSSTSFKESNRTRLGK